MQELGRLAFQTLEEMMVTNRPISLERTISTELIIRESTSPVLESASNSSARSASLEPLPA